MNKRLLTFLGGLVLLIVVAGFAILHQPATILSPPTPSSYADQQGSPIRGLSSQEVDDLRNGLGGGYARMAELNNYPGPRHVLDLSRQLGLSVKQEQQIQTVFQQMNAAAKPVGVQILEREQHLSRAFAGGSISEADLQTRTAALAKLYGDYRDIHLKAHLQITPLLTAAQIVGYNQLRGYNDTPSPTTAGGSGNVATPAEHHHMP